MKVGLDSYAFADKNAWRVRVWNRIAARIKKLGKVPKDCVVLYLAGPEDLDRPIAKRHGFAEHNLIAVELCQGTRKLLQHSGAISIAADIDVVLRSWSSARKVDVLLLDYCCGFEPKTLHTFLSFSGAMSDNAVILINLQRGRDSRTNAARKTVLENGLQKTLMAAAWPGGDLKHRGLSFLAVLVNTLKDNLNRTRDAVENPGPLSDPELAKKLRVSRFYKYVEAYSLQLLKPVFLSYRSGPLIMDSVLLTMPECFAGLLTHIGDDFLFGYGTGALTVDATGPVYPAPRGGTDAEWDSWNRSYERSYENRHVRHRIAAALAVRTRRLAAP